MDRALSGYQPPVKKNPTTRLWATAEEAAIITKTGPNRWLKSGEWVLEKSLLHLKEVAVYDESGFCKVKNKGAYLQWLIKYYGK